MKIPLTKPLTDNAEVEAVRQVLASGWLTQGPKVAEFEESVRKFVGADYAVACTSCTTALHMGMLTLGIKAHDIVLVPAFTWVATANVVEYVRARPLFVDIDLKTFNVDCQDVPRCFSTLRGKSSMLAADAKSWFGQVDVKAVIPVHLFGQCADMTAVNSLARDYRLNIIEDAACSLGSTFNGNRGIYGLASCLSFHPRKSISTGEGGMLLTDDRLIAEQARSLRDFGMPDVRTLGFNYKLSDILASVGVEQMKKLPSIVEARQKRARVYDTELANIPWLKTPYVAPKCNHTYQSYVTLVGLEYDKKLIEDSIDQAGLLRDKLMAYLADNGIATRFGTQAVHALPYYRQKYRIGPMEYPNAWAAQKASLTLPLYPLMTDEEQGYVIGKIKEFQP